MQHVWVGKGVACPSVPVLVFDLALVCSPTLFTGLAQADERLRTCRSFMFTRRSLGEGGQAKSKTKPKEGKPTSKTMEDKNQIVSLV